MNRISQIKSTNVNPAFRANYKVFQAKLKWKQATGPLLTRTQKIVDRLEGQRYAETFLDEKVPKETLAEVIREMWQNGDYYLLEGFNKKLGKLAKEVYKLL